MHMNDEKTHKEAIQAIRNASAEQWPDLLNALIGAGMKMTVAPHQAARAISRIAGQTPPGAEQPAVATPPDGPK
jgi:hypothetical protein